MVENKSDENCNYFHFIASEPIFKLQYHRTVLSYRDVNQSGNEWNQQNW